MDKISSQFKNSSLFWITVKKNLKKRILMLVPFIFIFTVVGLFFKVNPYTPLFLEQGESVERLGLFKSFGISVYNFLSNGKITNDSFFELQIFFWFLISFFLFGGIFDYVGKKSKKEKINIQSLQISDYKYFFEYYLVYLKIALVVIVSEIIFLLPYLNKTVENFKYSLTSFVVGNVLGVLILIPCIIISISILLKEFFD